MNLGKKISNVSVLMAVYIKENPLFLRESLLSLCEQELHAQQVVLVCDGPLSISLEDVIKEFLLVLPLKIIRLPENVGLARALNEGLKYCDCEWIARFDTDDICKKNRFLTQMNFLKDNPDIDVLGSSISEFDIDKDYPYAMRRVELTHDKISSLARYKNPMNHVTVIFRKSSVLKVGGYPLDALNEDYSLWIKLLANGVKFANISEPLVLVRAGIEMAGRRGGWSYFLTEFKMQKRILNDGFINIWTFCYNVSIRFCFRLMPNKMRNFLYIRFLRD